MIVTTQMQNMQTFKNSQYVCDDTNAIDANF